MNDPAAPPGSPDPHLLALVADRTHSAVIIADAGGRIEWVNPAFTRLTGYTPAEVVGRTPGSLLQGPGTDPATVAFMRSHIRAGDGFRTEVLNYRKDGTPYWLDVEVRPIRDGAGAVVRFMAVEHDITDRKRSEAELRRTLALQAAILDGTAACVVSTDTDGTVTLFNRAAEAALGYAATDVIGRETPALWHDPAEVARRAAALSAELGRPVAGFEALVARAAHGTPDTNEWTFVRRDGTWFPAELTVTALRDAAGGVAGYLGVATDITPRREVEAARAELAARLAEKNAALEEQLRLAALRAEVGLVLNENAPLPDLLRRCCEVVHRQTGAAFVRVWTVDGAEPVLVLRASVGLYTHTDGGHARVPVGAKKIGRIAAAAAPHLTNDVTADPLVDHEWAAREGMVAFAGHPLVCVGKVVGVLALFSRFPLSDETLGCLAVVADAVALGVARKQAEAAAREQDAAYRAVVESAVDCIITVDGRGRVVEFNPAAERTFGYRREEVLGRAFDDLLPSDEPSAGGASVLRQRETGVPARRKDGTRFPVELSVVPTRADGGPTFTAFLRDVTAELEAERRRRETEAYLQQAKEAAEAAARTQGQYLANMSHELRTPITAIVGYAEMLLDPRLGAEERVRAAQTIVRSGRHLTSLINDVLDLGRIEAGRMELERVPCRLRRLVAEVVSGADVGAREKHIDLRVVPRGKLPAVLTTDPTRLRQVLDNLLSNAVKFTGPGKGIELRLRLDAPDPAAARLVLEVEDQGVGIPADALPRLFQPFTQADASTTRKYGGTGLGLSICKRLVHLLGGEISVRSTPGVGTCFTVTVPVPGEDLADLLDAEEFAHESQLVKPRPEPPTRLRGRVLLAEDTLVNQTVLRYFLERAGLTVEVADNGRVAVEKALGAEFDVILMDMQMPEMDGYAATSLLRQKGYGRAIVALTAHALAGDEEKCLRAGCNAYLTKPVEADRLIKMVARQMPSRSWVVKTSSLHRAPQNPAPPPVAQSGLPAKLVADYRRALPDRVRAVAEALRAGDVAGASGLAHKLRGSAGMYGLPAVSEAAGRVEEACRAGRPAEQVAELVAALAAAGESG